MLLETFLQKKAIDTGYSIVKKAIENIDDYLVSDRTEFESAIIKHQKDVEIWSSEVETKEIQNRRKLENVFVPLDIYLSPRNSISIPKGKLVRKKLENALSSKNCNAVLLGQPGAGKTTASKHICRQMLKSEKIFASNSFPICLRFRDLSPLLPKIDAPDDPRILGGIIVPWILECFGVRLQSDVPLSRLISQVQISEKIAVEILEHFAPLIIFDGFDELTTGAARKRVLMEIKSLSTKLERTRFILTSRIGEFPYSLPNCEIFEISELDDKQIEKFSNHYLGKSDRDEFIKQIKSSPFYDTTIRPLTLVWLCAVYHHSRRIPETPKTVYRKVVNLLLEEWDEERMVTRISRYAGFQPDRKFDLLSRLSYHLTVTYKRDVFLSSELLDSYKSMCDDFDLPKSEARHVMCEIESHNGIILQVAQEKYCFAHKSIQEYLTAEYIVRFPRLPRLALISVLPNELAIATALSSSPSRFLEALISDRLLAFSSRAKNFGFLRVFLARLVQERPEFDANRNVIRALVILYSTYLTSGHTAQQKMLFYDDFLIVEFESLMDTVCKRNISFNPFQQYSERESALSWDNIEIVRMVRTSGNDRKVTKGGLGELGNMPRDLMCRRSFLNRLIDSKGNKAEPLVDDLMTDIGSIDVSR
jgi:hypothetical protein